jgi:hypothetical protein
MGFDQHRAERNRRALTEPALAIYKNGNGRFNKAAVDEWLSDVDAVELYLDHDAGELGVARGGDPTDGAFTLSHDHVISVDGILSKFGIRRTDIDTAVHLLFEHDPDEGLFVADLDPLLEVRTDD